MKTKIRAFLNSLSILPQQSYDKIENVLDNRIMDDIERFLDQNRYSEQTKAQYSYNLRRFNDWLIVRRLTFDQVTTGLLSKYLHSKNWGDNTQRAAGNAIKSFLRWKYGPDHPALSYKLPKDTAAPGRTLDQNQLEKLLSSFDTTTPIGWRNLAMISLMVETGLRASEVCGLLLRYLDIKKHHLWSWAKGGHWREAIYSDLTAAWLEMWLSARKEVAKPKVPYVFVSIGGTRPGTVLTPSGLQVIFRKIGLRTIETRLTPHDLRRSMATLLTEQGAPTRLVQKLGDWKSIQMVVRYTRKLKPVHINTYSPVMFYMTNSPAQKEKGGSE